MTDTSNILSNAIMGASRTGIVAAASSVLTGLATVSVPVKVLGLITVASTSAVSIPIVASVGAGGAIVGGALAAYQAYLKQQEIDNELSELLKNGKV